MAGKKLTAKNVDWVQEGVKIIIPEGMEPPEVLTWAKRYYEEQEQEVGIHAEIECFPLDGLVNLHAALAEEFGWVGMKPTPGFFGDTPPTMVTVPTGPNEHVQVGYGRIVIPQLGKGYIQTGMQMTPVPKLIIGGEVKQRYKKVIDRIVNRTQAFLRDHSIYKGQAIKVDFAWQRQGESFDPIHHAPKFWDVSAPDVLIFSDEVQNAMQIGLWSFIEYSPIFRQQRIPLKRGVLLSGPYGVGKTLSARETARRSIANGWTFIHLSDVQDLTSALRLASHYAPAVLFAEDVDQIVQGERSLELNAILNTLDGADSKDREIITVLTTNRMEVIHPSVLRPGRIDTLVTLSTPDAQAAIDLVRVYGGDMIAQDESLTAAGDLLAGKIPAVIREVVETAKAAAITRIMADGGSLNQFLAGGQVTEIDLINATKAKEMHNDLINRPTRQTKSPGERVADSVAQIIVGGLVQALPTVAPYLDPAFENNDGIAQTVERYTTSHMDQSKDEAAVTH